MSHSFGVSVCVFEVISISIVLVTIIIKAIKVARVKDKRGWLFMLFEVVNAMEIIMNHKRLEYSNNIFR